MTVKKGDFVLLDYTSTIKETGEVFDTTLTDIAKEHGILKSQKVFEPQLVIAGENWVVPGLDADILKAEVGETRRVELPPKVAFGERDQTKVKIVAERELLKQKIRPEVGLSIEVNGQLAVIRSINAGRVQLDFNGPFAGKTIIYDYQIKAVINDKLQKASEIIHRFVQSLPREKFRISLDDTTVRIEIPEDLLYWDSLQSFKIRVVRDLIRYLDEIETVEFTERFTYKDKETEGSKEAEPKIPASPAETPGSPATIESSLKTETQTNDLQQHTPA